LKSFCKIIFSLFPGTVGVKECGAFNVNTLYVLGVLVDLKNLIRI